MDKKYTIKDIAEAAGVSKGTVDRVLHGRGKVSAKSLAQVEKILKEIDYQPNPIARNLKNNKVYRIAVLMPDPRQDTYWVPAVQGINDAAKEFKPFGVSVDKYYYHPIDQTSFLEKSQEALKTKPDVLLMAPLFQKEVLEVFTECRNKNVLVTLFNNYNDTFSSENFIGQDLYQSGRVAASLIDKVVAENDTTAILHLDEEPHMKLKEDGFKSYFEEKNNSPKIETISWNTFDKELLKKTIAEFITTRKEISSVFVTNSKSYLFVEAIEGLCRNLTIVGYDLLEENIEYLRNGCIDFLIHQKPKRQAYLGVVYLAEHFVFGKPIPSQNLLPIDIITSENVKYYID